MLDVGNMLMCVETAACIRMMDMSDSERNEPHAAFKRTPPKQ